MKRPPLQPRSRLAHEAAAWAWSQGHFDALNEAIFLAFFERGEDIGEPEVLAALAANAGLDGEALRQSLKRHDHLDEVLADERRAARYGLTGVPAFVAGGAVLFGVQRAEALEELVRRASLAPEGDPEGADPLPQVPIKIGR
jgi:predicted DsbA family dithiol-disulfide isomerase